MSQRNIEVAVRVRPFLPQDNDKASDKQLLQYNGKKSLRLPLKLQRDRPSNFDNSSREEKVFSFDYVFTANATQLDVYKDTGMEHLVSQALDGYNATVFAYGHTGSGKTHTVVGDIMNKSSTNGNNFVVGDREGIISRAARAIFAALEGDTEKAFGHVTVKCTCKSRVPLEHTFTRMCVHLCLI